MFLGRLEDIAGTPELSLPLAEPATIATIAARLAPELAEALRNPRIRIAVGGKLMPAAAAWDETVGDGDEVAFLPPVSGG